jgi:hypothetical protein
MDVGPKELGCQRLRRRLSQLPLMMKLTDRTTAGVVIRVPGLENPNAERTLSVRLVAVDVRSVELGCMARLSNMAATDNMAAFRHMIATCPLVQALPQEHRRRIEHGERSGDGKL